jgi:hypothetical protein
MAFFYFENTQHLNHQRGDQALLISAVPHNPLFPAERNLFARVTQGAQ